VPPTTPSLPLARSASSFRRISAAICRNIWFSAAFEAAYAPKPSSWSRKSVAEPLSLEMKMIFFGGGVTEGEEKDAIVLRISCAQIMGPMVLV
jgi:hypothetical protein